MHTRLFYLPPEPYPLPRRVLCTAQGADRSPVATSNKTKHNPCLAVQTRCCLPLTFTVSCLPLTSTVSCLRLTFTVSCSPLTFTVGVGVIVVVISASPEITAISIPRSLTSSHHHDLSLSSSLLDPHMTPPPHTTVLPNPSFTLTPSLDPNPNPRLQSPSTRGMHCQPNV